MAAFIRKYFASILLSTVPIIIAWTTDYYLTHNFVVSSLYAVPMLVAAYSFKPKTTTIIASLSLALYIYEAYLEKSAPANMLFGSIGLLVVSVLAVQLSVQKRAILQYAQNAEDAQKKLQTFLAMVSHDLAQPLTAIKIYTQILNRPSMREQKKIQITQSMLKTTTQMERLINDLRDAAQVGSGKFIIKPQKTNLITILKSTIKEYAPALANHSLILDNPKKLYGTWDPDRLKQVFNNLISNAIKYSPKGGQIKISVENSNPAIRISISDTGMGMSKDQLANLFQPFSRQSKSSIKGTGLGLYISKAIIEAHKGKIMVKSKPGDGSTFTIELPAQGK